MITVIQQGFFSTIQDEGRWGYQAFGMPISGVMDTYAYRIANLLAGNSPTAAVIEMTGQGACFKFDEEQFVAVCGADMNGRVNGQPITNWSSFLVPKRGELSFHTAITGYRTYLAIRGGFHVPLVLGSRATYTKARVGGLEGRPLRQGDVLYIGNDLHPAEKRPQKLPPAYIPQYSDTIKLKVLLGPQHDKFTREAVALLFSSTYAVTDQSDRASCYLNGPRIATIGTTDIVSDAVCLGAIQVPASGLPFIVTADHQTTRGFAKIGHVIRRDLSPLAQATPGNSIVFTEIAEDSAIELLKIEQETYRQISNEL